MANPSAKYLSFIMSTLAIAACSGDNSEGLPPQPNPERDAATEAQPEANAEAAPEAASPEAAPMSDLECAGVGDQKAAVLFKAPQPRGEGFLAAAAWIHYPSMAAKPDVAWADPFPGCVALFATDQELLCSFGLAYQGTEVTFIFGMNAHGGPTEKLGAWFSDVKSDKTISYYGEYYACKGGKLVGTYKDGKFDGALAPTEVPANANLKYTIP